MKTKTNQAKSAKEGFDWWVALAIGLFWMLFWMGLIQAVVGK